MVANLINARGNATTNQFVIVEDGKIAFQSYQSRVCEISQTKDFKKVVKFGCDWDYSRTTMKHLTEFLRQNNCSMLNNSNTIRKAIKNGCIDDIIVLYDENMR